MKIRYFFVAVIAVLSLNIFSGEGFGKDEDPGISQKVKTSYSNLKAQQQDQKPVPVQKAAITNAGAVKAEPAKIETPVGEIEKKGTMKKDMTKEEILAGLKDDLADPDDLMAVMPELKVGADQNGKIIQTYKGVALDKLSKEDLSSLYIRVRQNLTRMRTERIERQLETVRRIERLQGVATPPQPPRVPSAPLSAPGAPSIQRVPSAPSSSPSAPRAQLAPSSPPSIPSAPSRR